MHFPARLTWQNPWADTCSPLTEVTNTETVDDNDSSLAVFTPHPAEVFLNSSLKEKNKQAFSISCQLSCFFCKMES